MGITVFNKSAQEVKVSVNHWGKDGNTDFFTISPGSSEGWDRSDERGFVMSMKKLGTQLPYYVQCNSEITVYDDRVTDHNVPIKPVS